MADHGPDPIPTKNNSRWKRNLKGYGKGNPPESVRASRAADRKDYLESRSNVTPPQQFRRGGKVRTSGKKIRMTSR